MIKQIIKKSIPYLLCLIIAFVIMVTRYNIFKAENLKEAMHILADATFVPGVVFFGIGVLVFASNEGTFDMLAFGVKCAIMIIFTPKAARETFYEYRVRKHEKKQPYKDIMFAGGLFIILAIIFSVIYAQQV